MEARLLHPWMLPQSSNSSSNDQLFLLLSTSDVCEVSIGVLVAHQVRNFFFHEACASDLRVEVMRNFLASEKLSRAYIRRTRFGSHMI